MPGRRGVAWQTLGDVDYRNVGRGRRPGYYYRYGVNWKWASRTAGGAVMYASRHVARRILNDLYEYGRSYTIRKWSQPKTVTKVVQSTVSKKSKGKQYVSKGMTASKKSNRKRRK